MPFSPKNLLAIGRALLSRGATLLLTLIYVSRLREGRLSVEVGQHVPFMRVAARHLYRKCVSSVILTRRRNKQCPVGELGADGSVESRCGVGHALPLQIEETFIERRRDGGLEL